MGVINQNGCALDSSNSEKHLGDRVDKQFNWGFQDNAVAKRTVWPCRNKLIWSTVIMWICSLKISKFVWNSCWNTKQLWCWVIFSKRDWGKKECEEMQNIHTNRKGMDKITYGKVPCSNLSGMPSWQLRNILATGSRNGLKILETKGSFNLPEKGLNTDSGEI